MIKGFLIYIIAILFICNCSSTDKDNLTYRKLPSDVRTEFNNIYDYYEHPKINSAGDTIDWYMAPFAECRNLKKNCNCEIESKGGIVRNPFLIINSCNRKAIISWEILQRVFVIKNDSIYFPNSKEASTTAGKARSFNIKIDTVGFYVQKMQ